MSRRVLRSIVFALLAAAVPGCVPEEAEVEVQAGPPAPQAEVVTVAPYPGAVWQPGYWQWNGRRYVWIRGHYERPRPGWVWIPPHWERRGPFWHFRRGYWRRI